ncbi:biotin synthase BioB [Maridesulfovibrio hydrothermalis]|uniref:Biotin synthase n=1 Tax=Maridesulfovibrio hydrothermalis AM13 = DSM 14728 TaxID=1121451 RepID=L0RE88_9BACT|nr:biotin synthase BioB [Maridesulfovibrio hydrothermalis]CCO23876.1 Biotin synthase [Maridesulfovibrio hydrothermalis AM13 = DSM 14728]
MDRKEKQAIWTAVHGGAAIDKHTAVSILGASHGELAEVLHAAHTMTVRRFGREVSLCSIANVRSGNCSEDCSFCAQSSHFTGTPAPAYPLMSVEEIQDCAEKAGKHPLEFFSYVTSGRALGGKSLSHVCEAVDGMPDKKFNHCASLGCLDFESLKKLRESGVKRYHHNLEASESFFQNVCTTHTYDERIRTVRDAKKAGLEVCCGGLLGLGESPEQRVELALAVAAEDVDSIPLNFLVPIPGTPLENVEPLQPLEILLTIAMFRLVNPHAEVRMAAGRAALRSLQSFIFHAGCNGLMVGDFLTVSGQGIENDLTMLKDLGLTVKCRD